MKEDDEELAADDWNPPEPDAFWKMTVASFFIWAAIAAVALLLWLCSLVCPI
jgi:hypothetical protein